MSNETSQAIIVHLIRLKPKMINVANKMMKQDDERIIKHGKDMLGAAEILQSWINGIKETIKEDKTK